MLKTTTCFSWIALFFCCYTAVAEVKLKTFFGVKPLKGDTIPHFNIFYEFEWNVKVYSQFDGMQNFICRADTLELEEVDSVFLSASFKAGPQLQNQYHAMKYYLSGSVKVYLNDQNILQTGVFAKDQASRLSNLLQQDYTFFFLNDTLVTMKIIYLPHPYTKDFNLKLSVGNSNWGNKEKTEQITDASENLSIGSFYFAFGVIFLVFFLFFNITKEHLYFSLFCFFSSLSFISKTFALSYHANNLTWFSLVIAIECLSMFFSKILLNQEKTKIPFSIILFVSLISFYPFFLYVPESFSFVYVSQVVIFSALLLYAVFSSLYYLFQGFGQKKWEAKAITFGYLIGLFFTAVLPFILSIAFQIKEKEIRTIRNYSLEMGLCLFPLTAAFVLGKRNGQNQKQLIQQVHSIEKLSKENLERELEKKQILENQNIELEKKVNERTVEIVKQKNIIEVKNKEITDNLTYAKRIQSAILPDIRLIYKTLENSFILFLPKDIVSGDFYGFAQKNDKVIIAAADCTGHGVAGAFMSMIGSSLLNSIINEKNITEPSLILDLLDEGIINALKQKDANAETHDGMDISICAFDLKNNTVAFAGADRPLWLIRNNELHFYKPNKFPIGGLQVMHDEKFTQHVIQLQKNDTIYIFSDGYADQFGGDKGKKLMTRRFRETLLSIQNKTMHEQEIYLKEYFEEWKGANEQVDDVLVIGIRV